FRQILLVDNAGIAHLFVKIVAFARPLAYPREHGVTAVFHRDIVNQLLDDNGLTHTGSTERANLAAARERAYEIDHFDAGLKNGGCGFLISQLRGLAMNGITFGEFYRPAFIDRISRD